MVNLHFFYGFPMGIHHGNCGNSPWEFFPTVTGIILTMKNRGLMGFKKIPQLVGGLEHGFYFPSIGKNHPNWRTHIFQRGRYTANQIWFNQGNWGFHEVENGWKKMVSFHQLASQILAGWLMNVDEKRLPHMKTNVWGEPLWTIWGNPTRNRPAPTHGTRTRRGKLIVPVCICVRVFPVVSEVFGETLLETTKLFADLLSWCRKT